jgi:hypothetical protein
MWVIILHDGVDGKRDDLISNLIGNRYQERYLSKISGNKKYSVAYNLLAAMIFKTESGAIRIIEEFNSTDKISKSQYSSKFNWINDRALSLRKLTKEEYFDIIDSQIGMKKIKFQRSISKLEKQKMLYK